MTSLKRGRRSPAIKVVVAMDVKLAVLSVK
jgi:hypothetical protein